MVKNRLKVKVSQDDEVKALLNEYETKIWAIWYKEKARFAYIDHKQLKDLISDDRLKFTGKYEIVDFGGGIQQKVWVDAIIVLTAEEQKAFADLISKPKPKDYEDEQGGGLI